jgi:hypothetical protein
MHTTTITLTHELLLLGHDDVVLLSVSPFRHGVTTQRIVIIFTATRTSNVMFRIYPYFFNFVTELTW